MVDLFSLNIQRQRDHGMVGYNTMRKHYNLKPIRDSYKEITDDRESGEALDKVYDGYNDSKNYEADLWVGIACEKPVWGGVMGEVGANLVG